jgi:hypothetical protein
VPEPRGDLVHGHAGLEQVSGPVGPERMRVRQPLGHPGSLAVAAHEPVHGRGGEGQRLLVAVAAETYEQRLLVEQPDAAGERMHFEPGLEGLLDGLGDRDLPLAAALAAHVEAVVTGVGARAAQVAGAQTAQLGGSQPAVAEHPQQRVIALARDRASIGKAQQVGVVGVGKRLRRPGLVPGHANALDRIFQTQITGQRTDHRQVHPHRCRRRWPPAAATTHGQVTAVRGDHVGAEIADDGRAAELSREPVAEGAKDRRVLAARARARGAGGDPVGLGEQVALGRPRPVTFGGRSLTPEVEDWAREAVTFTYLPALRDAEEDLSPGRGPNRLVALLSAFAPTAVEQREIVELAEKSNKEMRKVGVVTSLVARDCGHVIDGDHVIAFVAEHSRRAGDRRDRGVADAFASYELVERRAIGPGLAGRSGVARAVPVCICRDPVWVGAGECSIERSPTAV